MSGSSPLELLNDELLLTFNFNKYIFTAVYVFDKYIPWNRNTYRLVSTNSDPLY